MFKLRACGAASTELYHVDLGGNVLGGDHEGQKQFSVLLGT